MELDKAFLAALTRTSRERVQAALDSGVSPEDLSSPAKEGCQFVIDYMAEYGAVPTTDIVAGKFQMLDLAFHDQGADVDFLAKEIRDRATHVQMRDGLTPVLELMNQHQPWHAVEALEDLTRQLRAKRPGDDALDARVWAATAAEIAAEPEEVIWLWFRIIEALRVLVFTGQGGLGKTSFFVGLALHRAVGKNFLGLPVKEGKTVFLSAEDDRQTFHRKFRAWMAAYPEIAPNDVAGKVVTVDLTGLGIRFIDPDGRTYVTSKEVNRLIRLVQRHCPGADLVFLETASRFAGGDESNDAMTTLNEAANRMARELNATVIFSHHTGKTNTREARSDAYVGRGASSFSDAARGSLHMVACSTMEAPELARFLGHEPTRDEVERLVVLHNNKPNPNAPQAKAMVLERVANAYNIIYRLYDGKSLAASAGGTSIRDAHGWLLKQHVLQLASKNVLVSKSQLRDSDTVRKMLDVKKGAMSDVITHAIADGYLMDDGPKKGGYPTVTAGQKNPGVSGNEGGGGPDDGQSSLL